MISIYNNINTNSRFNYGSTTTTTAAAAAIAVIFALAVAVLCACVLATNQPKTLAFLNENGNRQNLVNFQRIELKLGRVFIRIERTIRLGQWIVPFYLATVFKKRVCVYKYCLVKHDLNCIVQSFSFTEHNRFECGLDRHLKHNERYNPLQQ